MKLVLNVFFLVAITGCSTWKKETLAYMGGALAAGAVIGAVQAPTDDNQAMHSLLWGGALSAITGGTRVYMKDESEDLRERDLEIKSLKMQLSENKRVLDEGNSQFLKKDLPSNLDSLMTPGSWKLYEIDEWKKAANGRFVHQDRLLKIKPAKIKLKK